MSKKSGRGRKTKSSKSRSVEKSSRRPSYKPDGRFLTAVNLEDAEAQLKLKDKVELKLADLEKQQSWFNKYNIDNKIKFEQIREEIKDKKIERYILARLANQYRADLPVIYTQIDTKRIISAEKPDDVEEENRLIEEYKKLYVVEDAPLKIKKDNRDRLEKRMGLLLVEIKNLEAILSAEKVMSEFDIDANQKEIDENLNILVNVSKKIELMSKLVFKPVIDKKVDIRLRTPGEGKQFEYFFERKCNCGSNYPKDIGRLYHQYNLSLAKGIPGVIRRFKRLKLFVKAAQSQIKYNKILYSDNTKEVLKKNKIGLDKVIAFQIWFTYVKEKDKVLKENLFIDLGPRKNLQQSDRIAVISALSIKMCCRTQLVGPNQLVKHSEKLLQERIKRLQLDKDSDRLRDEKMEILKRTKDKVVAKIEDEIKQKMLMDSYKEAVNVVKTGGSVIFDADKEIFVEREDLPISEPRYNFVGSDKYRLIDSVDKNPVVEFSIVG